MNNVEKFKIDHPAEYAEMSSPRHAGSRFMTSLLYQIGEKGSLSEKQLDCVRRSMPEVVEAQDEYFAAPAAKPVLELSAVFGKFNLALECGLKRPKLRLDGVCFSLCIKGRHLGKIFVKDGPTWDDTYLGVVEKDGTFKPSRDCDNAMVDKLTAISSDVIEAAQAFGKETGSCSCCGRELTDPKSIEVGIGPVCASRWGM